MTRNELCACGSGKRFKHCHGAIGSAATSTSGTPPPPPAPAGSPSALHREALAAHRTGALGRAETLYRRALERDPRDLDSLHMLGVVHFERLRYREALALLLDACERSRWNDPVFRHNLGLVLAKLLGPRADERQEALVRAYVARERERSAAPVVEARVSVVLTAGGASRFIGRAVDSVAAQTYRNLEVVVVDHGSTGEIASALAPRLVSLGIATRMVTAANRSEPGAANEGASQAQGRYLAFLRADDWFAPRRIERMVAEIARATPLWGFSRVGIAAPGATHAGQPVARPGAGGSDPLSFVAMTPDVVEADADLFIERDFFAALGGFRDVADYGADLRERAAREIEPVVIRERLYLRDAPADPAAEAARRASAEARLWRALAPGAAPANPFNAQHPANRDVLLRAALRAGGGDRIDVPVLRALASEELGRSQKTPSGAAARAPAVTTKTAIVVLGPYRSGTSALARVLNLCGAHLPQRTVAARIGVNPKGFWESEAVNDLNARLMQYLGADWDRVGFALPDAGPLVEEFLENSHAVLESEHPGAPLVLLKDPRICVLAPLWHRALKQNGYRPAYVVCVRNPLEVARSLRNDMPTPRGLALWGEYMRRVEDFVGTPGVDAVHVRYAALLDDWRAVVARIARALDVPLDVLSHASEIDEFLERGLRNHRATDAELDERLAGAQDVAALYRQMLARC